MKHAKERRRQQQKSKTKINEVEDIKSCQFFERNNKIDKPLTRLIKKKKKRENIDYQYQD